MRIERIVITGGGLAGLRTAAELRAREYPGRITMVGAEPHPPYDRPPLSKKLMLGELDSTSMADDAAALGLDLRLGEAATGLDDGLLRTGRGEFRFDRLMVATGAAPIRLPGPGPQHVLRTIDDALAIRAALRPGTRLAIVGAGWIGAELATVAAARGCAVTVLEAAAAPAAAALGADVGALLVPWYAAAGVELRLGQPVESVQEGGLALPGGGWLDADLVITAVGAAPCTGWLAGSGVQLAAGFRDAVQVDGQLRASIPGVYAAGDCAAFWSGRYGQRLRVEHWDTALHAPEVAAASLLGQDAGYDPVPYVWSDQFGRTVQCVGDVRSAQRWVWREADAGWCAFGLSDESSEDAALLVAAVGVGLPRDVVQARRVMERSGGLGPRVDEKALTDASVAVRSVVLG